VSTATGRREMRRFIRRPAALSIMVRATGNPGVHGVRMDSSNLSEGGAFLLSELLFEVGEALDLEIPLITGSVLRASARVVRVARDHDPTALSGMGVEFTGLSDEDRQVIQEKTPWQRPSKS
jgi:c-di-GMP-binding flagellar brake protein YcgR